LAAFAGVDVPMTAAAPVTDAPAAPAAIVKTCRREIPSDPVMTRRPVVRGNQLASSGIVSHGAVLIERKRAAPVYVCD
jgi:hypothetical protein